jgi:20S proteasome subunit alpha 6
MYGQNQSHQGANQVPLGGNSRGGMGGRGGSMTTGRGRGGSMGGTRGGLGGQRGGRGGGSFMSGGGGRGGQQGSLRGHGSRGGFGTKQDFHNRRGGSFNAGHQQHHQGNMGNTGFRGRGQGHSSGRAGRQDGSSTQLGNRDTLSASFTSSGKKDENRRTLTDFKIVGLEMPELGWAWGVLPSAVKLESKDGVTSVIDSSHAIVKEESIQSSDFSSGERADVAHRSEHAVSDASAVTDVKAEPPVGEQSSLSSPPPSRIRIYFHTPVSPDDSHPIPHNSSYAYGTSPMDSRKGKRKKLEDDDGDAEEGRGRPPPPRGSQMSDTASVDMDGIGRGSAAPSVAETASEGDWLMAAIAEDDADTADVEVGAHGEHVDDEDDNQLRVSRVEDPHVAVSESIPGLGGDIINGEFPTDLEYCYDECFRVWMEGVHLTIGGFTRLTLTPEGARIDGHGTGDDCAAVAIHDTGDHDSMAVGNDPASVPSDAIAKKCTSSPSQSNVDVVSTHEEGVELATPEATKPLHSELDTENGNEAVLSGCSSLTEPSCLTSQYSSSLSSSFDVSSSRASAPPPATAAQSDIPQLDKQSADYAGPLDTLAPIAEGAVDVTRTVTVPNPLKSHPSFASTTVDDSPDNGLFSQEEEIMTQVESALHDAQTDEKIVHDLVHDDDQEHLPEPPASPTSNTLLSTSSGSTYGEPSHQPVIPSPKKGKTPSANRLSISYAAGSRRLVVDAEVVEYLRVYRAEGRIEVHMSLDKDDEECLKGVLVCMVPTFSPCRYQQRPGRRAFGGY